jgi:hypothetical protein
MSDSYLLQCRQNYFDNITPSNISSREKEGYKKIVAIAKDYFNRGDYKEFSGFFREGQYFIALWAAHMIIEYGSPSNDLRIEAIDVIKKYSDNPLAPEVAEEEREWIRNNRSIAAID